ncbi:MAG TPA: VanZ family protein [Candidatus Eisenbacteria bacterium]|nr:VanZ family protein [Candidatus Eisenbacteria bacterium]
MPPKFERAAERAAAAWLATGLYACLIFAISAIPHIPVPPKLQMMNADKLFHMIEYGFFGVLIVRSFGFSFEFPSEFWLGLAALAAGVVYATTDEFHQKFVPGRSSDLMDGLADTAGLAAGIALWLFRSGRKTSNDRRG